MPIYEFACQTCSEPFEKFVRSSLAIQDVSCPGCGSSQVQKLMSTFASHVAGGTRTAPAVSAPSCSPGGL